MKWTSESAFSWAENGVFLQGKQYFPSQKTMFSRQENAIVLRIIHEEFEAIRDKGNIQLYMNTSQIINVFDKKI